MNPIVWAIVFVILVIAELATCQLVSIWFAIGALSAFAVSFFLPVWAQIGVFIIVSVVTLLITKPLLQKMSVKSCVPTNFELNIGKTGIVTEEINAELHTGRVKLGDVYWQAVSEDNEIIPVNTSVTVTKVELTTLTGTRTKINA